MNTLKKRLIIWTFFISKALTLAFSALCPIEQTDQKVSVIISEVDKELKNIPQEYHSDVISHRDSFEKDPHIIRDNIEATIRKIIWGGIATNFGFKDPMFMNGYLFIDSPYAPQIFKHSGSTPLLHDWVNAVIRNEENTDVLLKNLTNNYKIHLMPTGMMIPEIITLLKEVMNNEALRDKISNIKFFLMQGDTEIRKEKNPFPKIVIYPISGKENAQFVLNSIFEVFGNTKGLDITPRYNKKITSLIYYAQGNGDEKVGNFKKYFEQPDMVHYRSDISGETQDYHLQDPTTTPITAIVTHPEVPEESDEQAGPAEATAATTSEETTEPSSTAPSKKPAASAVPSQKPAAKRKKAARRKKGKTVRHRKKAKGRKKTRQRKHKKTSTHRGRKKSSRSKRAGRRSVSRRKKAKKARDFDYEEALKKRSTVQAK